jgi:hypothetical protein
MSGCSTTVIVARRFSSRPVLPRSVAISVASVRVMFYDLHTCHFLGTPDARARPRARNFPHTQWAKEKKFFAVEHCFGRQGPEVPNPLNSTKINKVLVSYKRTRDR